MFVVSFDDDFTEVGTYQFIIPGGTFIFDGEAHEEEAVINVELYKFEIKDPEVVSTTPVKDENGHIVAIRIEFNQQIYLSMDENYQTISRNISLMDANNNAINLLENWNPDLPYTTLEYVLGAYDENWNIVTTPITEAGTYTLDLSQIVVDYAYDPNNYDYMAKNGYYKGTYTLVVSEGESVENVTAEGEQVIYDLLGRRVESITVAGLYIVNGKKVIVK